MKWGLFSFALYPGPMIFNPSTLLRTYSKPGQEGLKVKNKEKNSNRGKDLLLTFVPCSVRSGESRIYYALG
jgi:hypothetical protein